MQTYTTLGEILLKSKTIKVVNDVLNNLEVVLEVAREDVKRVAQKEKLYFEDFDFFFGIAKNHLLKTAKKVHLKAIKKLNKCQDIEYLSKWLVARLLNTMVNVSTNIKYLNYLPSYKIRIYYEEEQATLELDDKNFAYILAEEDVKKILKYDRNKIKIGLKKVWGDAIDDKEFDLQDFQDLCHKYGFEMDDVLGYDPKQVPIIKVERTESGHSQFVLFFDPIEDQDSNYNEKEWGVA